MDACNCIKWPKVAFAVVKLASDYIMMINPFKLLRPKAFFFFALNVISNAHSENLKDKFSSGSCNFNVLVIFKTNNFEG